MSGMSFTGRLLRNYVDLRGETDGAFATACGVDPGNFSKIVKGQLGVSADNLKRFVAAFSGDRAKQAELVVAALFDYLPSEFANLVEIRKKVGGGQVQVAELPVDDFQAALNKLSRFGHIAGLRDLVMSASAIADQIKTNEDRAKRTS